jgi:hypothetical protein
MTLALVCAGAGLLAACSGASVSGTPSPASGSSSQPRSSSSSPSSSSTGTADVPKVQNPLPATVLDGSPCDSALTTEQVTSYIGQPKAPDRQDTFDSGPACTWFSMNSGQIGVYYLTKWGGGLDVAYTQKSQMNPWEPTTIQGYPAVAYANKDIAQSVSGACNVTVGIRDDLAFGVGLALGDNARERGVDSCAGAKEVADAVLTNLKGR